MEPAQPSLLRSFVLIKYYFSTDARHLLYVVYMQFIIYVVSTQFALHVVSVQLRCSLFAIFMTVHVQS